MAVAGLAVGCMGGGGPTTDAQPAAQGDGEQSAPLPPSDLAAKAAPFRVVLTWEPPPEGAERVEVFRDGARLALLPGTRTSYTDEDVLPDHVYNYEVASRTADLVSGRTHVTAETPAPSLGMARVEGTFDVSTRFTSRTGYSDYERPSYGWKFQPRCREGPCDVRWSDLHEKRIHGTLERTGPRYRGSYTGQFYLRCGSSPATSVVTVDLRVDAAKPIGPEWRATRLVGTLEHSEAVQLGCGSSRAELTVRARLVQ